MVLAKRDVIVTKGEVSQSKLDPKIVAKGVKILVIKIINCMYVCVCILNWPLPIGAFQDQYKQIFKKHN